jgi:hypothetical protein
MDSRDTWSQKKGTWGDRKKADICKIRRENQENPNQPAPSFWTSSLQSYEERNFWCWSIPIDGIWWWQPQETKIDRFHGDPMYSPVTGFSSLLLCLAPLSGSTHGWHSVWTSDRSCYSFLVPCCLCIDYQVLHCRVATFTVRAAFSSATAGMEKSLLIHRHTFYQTPCGSSWCAQLICLQDYE